MTATRDSFETRPADAFGSAPAEETTQTRLRATRFESVFPIADALQDGDRPAGAGVGDSESLMDFYRMVDRSSTLPVPRLGDDGVDLRRAVESFENQLIRQALDRTKWNKKRAAELLGINRTTLVEMLKRKRIEAA
jgi:DNA-binding NtrC family response regulator